MSDNIGSDLGEIVAERLLEAGRRLAFKEWGDFHFDEQHYNGQGRHFLVRNLAWHFFREPEKEEPLNTTSEAKVLEGFIQAMQDGESRTARSIEKYGLSFSINNDFTSEGNVWIPLIRGAFEGGPGNTTLEITAQYEKRKNIDYLEFMKVMGGASSIGIPTSRLGRYREGIDMSGFKGKPVKRSLKAYMRDLICKSDMSNWREAVLKSLAEDRIRDVGFFDGPDENAFKGIYCVRADIPWMGDYPPLLEGKAGEDASVAYLRLSAFTERNIGLAKQFLTHYCFIEQRETEKNNI